MRVRAIANPLRGEMPPCPDPSGAGTFHRSLEGYRPTPLTSAPALATAAGVGRVLVKDESVRLGLPSFKALGASWACHRVLQRHLGDEALGVSEVGERVRGSGITFATATDGNHGRAVAHMARLYGVDAIVFVPDAMTAARIGAIESEGATVVVVDGSYDDAVAAAASVDDALIVSDTAWDGYDEIPRWVVEGYATMLDELVDAEEITAVLVPVGVGALASAVAQWFRGRSLATRLVTVEPETADCVYVSVARGRPELVPGPHRSMMAGLNCGTPSPTAWPYVACGFDACVAIDDDAAERGMCALADSGIVAGETGAASTGALLAIAADPSAGSIVGLGADDTVLLLVTEGATDPVSYQRIVGRQPG